jgi:hypothetical protein
MLTPFEELPEDRKVLYRKLAADYGALLEAAEAIMVNYGLSALRLTERLQEDLPELTAPLFRSLGEEEQKNVRRVHEAAVLSARKRSHPFTMTLQDTVKVMFNHASHGLLDKNFELWPDLVGPERVN